MYIRNRGPFIYASYQVSVHLATQFQRRRLKCEKLTDDGQQLIVKAHFALVKKSTNQKQKLSVAAMFVNESG